MISFILFTTSTVFLPEGQPGNVINLGVLTFYGVPGRGNVYVTTTYANGQKQMLRCRTCGTRFAETRHFAWGDWWVWCALDPQTTLLVAMVVGERMLPKAIQDMKRRGRTGP
jgi:hypothetical protein